jgi:signal transduction histidine kinase
MLARQCGADDPETQEMAQEVISGVNRIDNVIVNMLATNAIGQGPSKPLRKRFELLKLCRHVASRFGGRVEVEGGEQEVNWDEQKMDQVLQNLFDNAVKYSPPGEPVRCSVGNVGDMVVVRVADRGVGMTEDQVAHATTCTGAAPTRAAPTPRAWGWAWPSSRPTSRPTAAASASRARSAGARPSP